MPVVVKPVQGNRSCLPKFALGISAVVIVGLLQVALAQERPRRFTVAEDVQLNRFTNRVNFSPDNQYFVVSSERGRLDINRPESSLRLYRTEEVTKVLSHSDITGEPQPVWTINKSTYKNGPI